MSFEEFAEQLQDTSGILTVLIGMTKPSALRVRLETIRTEVDCLVTRLKDEPNRYRIDVE